MQLPHVRFVSILTGAIAALLTSAHALDGISAQPVTDINPKGDSNPSHIVCADDKLYFVATDSKNRSALYAKTLIKGRLKKADPDLDKKPARIKSLTSKHNVTSETDNFVVAPNTYPPNRNTLYFHVKGDGLYTTRGTPLSTLRLLKWNDVANNVYVDPQVTAFQGSGSSKKAGVVFTAFKAATGFEPFITTGTPKTTKLMSDIVAGQGSSFPYDYCVRPSGIFQDQIIFGAYDSTDFFQLHRYRQNDDEKGFTLEHFNVSRNGSQADNLQTYPAGMTLAGNDVVFTTGNHAADNGRDLGLLDTTNGLSSVIPGTTNIFPINLETGSSGGTAYFAGLNNSAQYVFWQCAGGFAPFAQIYDTTIVGLNPRDIKTFPPYNTANPSQATYVTYVIADEGGSPRLYRKFSQNDSIKIRTNTNAELIVTDYNAVIDPGGNGHIFIVGHTAGNADILWVLDNTTQGTIDEQAEPVLTEGGFPLIEPSNLANATHLAGATAYSRLYFSCKGVGTEFEFELDKHGNPTTTPRGEEVWVYQVAE